MRIISEILNNKGHEVFSIAPDATVYDAIHLMAEKVIGAVLVMEGDKLVGVISERDYARQIILKDRSSRNTLVQDIMSRKVICIRPDDEIEAGMTLMTEKRIRHLPVVDHKKVIGVVSIGDLVNAVLAEQRFTIDQLERYITG